MTNREAIEKFKKIKRGNIFLIHQRTEGKEVIEDFSLCDMAISALQAQDAPDINVGDMISRQAAIEDLHTKDPSMIWDTADVEVWVNALPSAQPETHEERTETLACDCISRQAAIDALKERRALFCDNTPDTFAKLPYGEKCRVDELDGAIATLINLPSAQPDKCDRCRFTFFEKGEEDDGQ